MIRLSTSSTSCRLGAGRSDQTRVSGPGSLAGCGRGGDCGSVRVGHGGPPSDWPSSSSGRDWHHCASSSSAAALILGGPACGYKPSLEG